MKLTAPVTRECLTPAAVEWLTGLDVKQINNPALLPNTPGIYLWAQSWNSGIYYHGQASGKQGLGARVGQELRMRNIYREEVGTDSGDLLDNERYVWANPLMRLISSNNLVPFIAPTVRAPWAADSDPTPQTPAEWEAFISECSRILVGHRSLMGGSSWWTVRGSVGERMTVAAVSRLRSLRERGQFELLRP